MSIDAKKQIDGTYQCYSHSGSVAQQRTPESWAREVVDKGAGEILLTSIERDGTMTGYDLELIKSVTEAVSIPVIASGGAANYTDLCLAIKQGGAQAVAASSMFHFTEQTPLEAKAFLASQGISVRK